MRALLISIQPYWVFLIIAKTMGWNIGEEKTVEIRKNCPKNDNWNKTAKIYCTKDKKSFSQIPKEYRPLMERLSGKVIGEFVCDDIKEIRADNLVAIYFNNPCENTCLNDLEMREYANGKNLFLWHISNLVIYDEPRELSEFYVSVKDHWETYDPSKYVNGGWKKPLKRPPQSWCYVESGGVE